MIRPIITVPHATLLKKAVPIKVFDKKLLALVQDMTDTLLVQKDPIGVGLSAPQIDVLMRVCIIRADEDTPARALVNPRIIKSVQGRASRKPLLEGCLSIPRIWGYVLRPEKVHVEYEDLSGKTHSEVFTGFDSIVVQHEIDHLDGILFTRHTLSQGYQLYKEVDGELEPYAL